MTRDYKGVVCNFFVHAGFTKQVDVGKWRSTHASVDYLNVMEQLMGTISFQAEWQLEKQRKNRFLLLLSISAYIYIYML